MPVAGSKCQATTSRTQASRASRALATRPQASRPTRPEAQVDAAPAPRTAAPGMADSRRSRGSRIRCPVRFLKFTAQRRAAAPCTTTAASSGDVGVDARSALSSPTNCSPTQRAGPRPALEAVRELASTVQRLKMWRGAKAGALPERSRTRTRPGGRRATELGEARQLGVGERVADAKVTRPWRGLGREARARCRASAGRPLWRVDARWRRGSRCPSARRSIGGGGQRTRGRPGTAAYARLDLAARLRLARPHHLARGRRERGARAARSRREPAVGVKTRPAIGLSCVSSRSDAVRVVLVVERVEAARRAKACTRLPRTRCGRRRRARGRGCARRRPGRSAGRMRDRRAGRSPRDRRGRSAASSADVLGEAVA